MLRRSSLVECVSVLHGTCLQCVEFFFIHQYVQPCLSKNPKYTFYTKKSLLTLAYYLAFWSCDMVRKLMRQTTQKGNKHWHGRKGWEKESNTVKGAFYYLAPLPVLDPICRRGVVTRGRPRRGRSATLPISLRRRTRRSMVETFTPNSKATCCCLWPCINNAIGWPLWTSVSHGMITRDSNWL
jgi:hypothetical protein